MRTKLLFTAVFLCAAISSPAPAIDISLLGNWVEHVGARGQSSRFDEGLRSSYESSVDEVVLNIFNTGGISDKWRVDVRRSDTNWSDSLVLWVKRTGPGAGTGSAIDGTFYQEVTGSDVALFSGNGDRTGITIRLRITGISAAVSPNNYLTSIVYTVVDLP